MRTKDLVATLLTAAIVGVFLATREGWGIPLVGDSRLTRGHPLTGRAG
jgi:hypothetical protein